MTMRMSARTAARLCATGMLVLGAACTPLSRPGLSIAVSVQGGYQIPPGAQPVALSAQPGEYDYTGIARVTFNGQPVTPADALNRSNEREALTLSQIAPLAPLAGRLLIVIPDHDRLRLLSLQRTRGVAGGPVEFQTEYQRLNLHYDADAVRQAQAFASVDIVERNDTVWPTDAGADDILWFQVQSVRPNNAGPWMGSWQMRRANGAATLAVSFDPGTPVGPPRMMSFVNSVREVAGALAGSNPSFAERGRAGPLKPGRPVSSGSGIVVDSRGHVLTDNHVIANCPDVRVTNVAGGSPVGATLIANDARLDLALLQTAENWPAHARFRDSATLRPGEPLVATGFPLAGLVSPEMAVTTGSLTALSGGQGNDRVLQFSAPVQPGNSGGPVLDASGHVVGITTFELNGLALAALTGGPLPQNVNFATKTDVARTYLAGLSVRLDEGSDQAALDPARVAEMARKFTTKVECWR